MKLKDRFRKSLFSFFKEEILNIVKPEPIVPYSDVGVVRYESRNMDLTRLTASIKLSDKENMYEPAHVIYEKQVENLRKELFNKAMEFCHVEERSVTDPYLYDSREIIVHLYVGKR